MKLALVPFCQTCLNPGAHPAEATGYKRAKPPFGDYTEVGKARLQPATLLPIINGHPPGGLNAPKHSSPKRWRAPASLGLMRQTN